MKQILFATLSLFLIGRAIAQENDVNTFLKDNKTWLMRYKLVVNPDEHGFIYRFYETTLKGDTIIDGIPFKRVFQRTYIPENTFQNEKWTSTPSWLGQDDSKIYLYERLWGETFELRQIMDFSKNVGDILTLGEFSFDENSGIDFMVMSVSDTILESSIDKLPRKCLYLQNKMNPEEKDVWVDGIGSLLYGITGIVMGSYSGSIPFLMKCEEGEDILYQFKENETPIQKITPDEVLSTGICYDLQGRRIQGNKVIGLQGNGQLPRGVYIQNGRKFVVR